MKKERFGRQTETEREGGKRKKIGWRGGGNKYRETVSVCEIKIS